MSGIDRQRGQRVEEVFAGPGEMRARCRALDWSATALGEVAQWPATLRFAARLCLDNARPMCVFGGPELVHIYNDSYATAVGTVRHPRALGRPAREIWSDIWGQIEHEYEQVMSGGAAVEQNGDLRYVVDRGRGPEETYWNYAISPIRDDDGSVVGCYTLITDITSRVQSEEELRRSEARYRMLATAADAGFYRAESIIERMGDAFCVLDRNFIIIRVNAAAERLLEMSRDDLLGRSHWEVFPASVDAPVGQVFRRVVAQGSEQHITHHYTGEGHDLHLELDTYPTDEGGVAMFWRDISERVRAEEALRASEERHAFFLALSDALRLLGDPEKVKATAARLLGEHLEANRVFYADAQNKHWIVAKGYEFGVDPLPNKPFPMSAYGDWIIDGFRSGQRLVVADMSTDSRFDADERNAHLALQIGAEIAVPLIRNGELVAMLVAHSATPREWTPREISLLDEAAQRTWGSVELMRLQRNAEEANALLVRFADGVRGLTDSHAIAEVACRLMADSLGTERAYWAEIDWERREYVIGAAFHVSDVPAIGGRFPLDAWEPFTTFHLEGRPVVVDDTQSDPRLPPEMRAAYEEIAVGADLATPVSIGGRLRCTLAVNQHRPRRWTPEEVSLVQRVAERCWAEVERARAEEALRESEAHQVFLLALSDALRAEKGVDAVGKRAVEMIADVLMVDRVYLVSLNPDDDRVLVTHETRRPDLPPLLGEYRSSMFPSAIREIFERTIVYDDVRADERLTDLDRASFEGLNAVGFMAASVRRGAETMIWAAGAVSTKPRAWTAGEVVLFEDAIERAWAAIERARAEAALRESEEKYRNLFEQIDEGFCIVEVIFNGERAVDYRFLEINPAFEGQTGIQNVAGRRMREIAPEHEQHWFDAYGEIALTGRPTRFDARAKALGNRWYELNAFRVGEPEQRRVAIIFRDVSERKRAEERQAFLLRFSDALRSESDAEAVAMRALGMLAEQLGADRCYVGVYRPNDDRADLGPQVGNDRVPPFPASIRLSDFPEALRIASQRSLVVDDAATKDGLSDVDRRSMAALGIGALVAAAVRRRENNPLWTIVVVCADRRHWSAADIALIEEAAERTWAAVERARAATALRASEEQFRRSIEEAPIPVIMHAEDGAVLQISRTWTELTGWEAGEVPTFEAWLTHAYGEGADAVREHVHALFTGSTRTMNIEFPVRTRRGELRHWSFSASAPGTLHDGRRFVVGMALDITERRRAEEALRASEERYRTLVENVSDYAIFMVDPDGFIVEWTSGAERVKGYSAEEVLGRHLSIFFTPEEAAAGEPDRALEEAASRSRSEREGWRVRRDGTRFWGNEVATAIRDAEGRLTGFTKICRDLTEEKAFQDALQHAHDALEERVRERTAEVQALFRRLVSTQEEERRRIARDIHDQLGQQITALRMHVASLATRGASDGGSSDLVNRVQGLAEELDQSVDFLTWQLRPAALDHLGLPAAVAHLVSGWSERFGISADYQSFGAAGVRVPAEAESNLYHLIQEALHNIVKHARATHVSVILGKHDGRLMIAVEDDGVGFEVPGDGSSAVGALGLISMRERATLVGGDFAIESAPGQGTTIVVKLPLEEA